MKCIRKLGATDIKYKIICAGSKFHIGFNQPVVVQYNGRMYQAKMHSTSKGRIDGLGKMFSDFSFSEGQELSLSYDSLSNVINICSLSSNFENDYYLDEDDMEYDPFMSVIDIAQEFEGEYYGFDEVDNTYNSPLRAIARYGDNLYFAHKGDIITCKYEYHASKSVFIKNPMGLRGMSNYNHLQIFANNYGLFVYNFDVKHGNICKLFDFNGKEKGCFRIEKTGRTSDSNLINRNAYIKDDYFFCVTGKEYWVYHFGTQQAYSSKFKLNDGAKITGMCVDDTQVYLGIREKSCTQWYRLRTSENLLYTNGVLTPIFNNLGEYEMRFIHPKKGVAWLVKKRSWDEYEKHEKHVYMEVSLKDGRFTGKKYYVSGWFEINEVAYFDGSVMYVQRNNENMHKVNLTTGETIKLGGLCGVFESSKFLVYGDKLYVTNDDGFYEHYIVSIPVDEKEPDLQICKRVW